MFPRGRWMAVDLRPWGGGRPTMRDPNHPAWPDEGERTPDEEVAERWKWRYLDLMRGEHRERVLGERKPRRLADAIPAWLEHRERTVERMTVVNSRTASGHLLDLLGPDYLVERIGAREWQRLVDHMLDRGYMASSVRTMRNQLAAFAQWAGVPIPRPQLPEPGGEDVRTFDATERARIREAAARLDGMRRNDLPPARLAVEIGLSMGLRQGEIFALRWEDIDPETRSVRVQRQLPKDRTILKPLKGKRARSALILPEWWDWHRTDGEGLILHRKGQIFHTRGQRDMIRRVYDLAGISGPGLGWHALRHSFARSFVEAGGLIQELQVSLGHTSIRTTEQHYGHFMEHVALGLARRRVYGLS